MGKEQFVLHFLEMKMTFPLEEPGTVIPHFWQTLPESFIIEQALWYSGNIVPEVDSRIYLCCPYIRISIKI